MEPFSAFAVAATAVQFVDFSSKLLSRVLRVYRGPTTADKGHLLDLELSSTLVISGLIGKLTDHLRFPEINEREARVPRAYANTFEWIFQPGPDLDPDLVVPPNAKETTFRDWLLHGHGIYYIAGKAGSGKSTLLKFIYEDPRTAELLSQWSSPKHLILFEVQDANYFFLVDGLDEFDSSSQDLVELLNMLGSLLNVRLCVSSRPLVVFEDAYGRNPGLRLEDMTRPDISSYVNIHFWKHPAFPELFEVDPDFYSKIVRQVTIKASGIFLWVVLVGRSLMEGLANGDRPEDLQRRLDEIPAELENLFATMLDNLEPRYFVRASNIFQIFRAAKRKPTLLCMSFANEEDQTLDSAGRRRVTSTPKPNPKIKPKIELKPNYRRFRHLLPIIPPNCVRVE
ncbi:hypothetical protein B0T26DRAFT_748580 [Lasiosphaeria miniovina]|uniref:NACHT domain-containing protein n=1 Tax=Lasiosphaeria miniovina TaxID=1954250 RepID=A0AA40E8X2_9PEZI|nr:uncharacterized protein B0T26DRAFT_748580 [Lasiosphaeria miniovina]KAK0728346.1 hypothetical protein B0T26DRAFT_748580 [Lasiosphaeria miniovina]